MSSKAEEAPVILAPSAGARRLDESDFERLGQVGERWSSAIGERRRWERALPVDPSLVPTSPSDPCPTRFGRFVTVGPGQVQARLAASVGKGRSARAAQAVRRVVLGAPLASSAVIQERMRKLIALPVLSSDALASVAYGPEALMAILVLGGSGALGLSLPIAAALVVLMIAVGLSYRQTIRAYPRGGGSYIVASDSLGHVPGVVAAAGLMIDYVLTVAVSVASGVAAVTSALPSLAPATVPIGLGVIGVLLAGNLRGVRQAGLLFAAPTYLFIAAMLLLIVTGLADVAGRGFERAPPPALTASEGVGLLLALRAFGSGATAMTGIEAISDGIPAFRHVEWRNARTTLTIMMGLLVTMFAGTMLLVHFEAVVPVGSETLLSQLGHRTLGSGPLYVYLQAATALILLFAANTAFSDFPRLLFFLARDGNAPSGFLHMGDRLAFTRGITLLAVAAGALFVAFDGSTGALIPLFAVGVFLAFTLSQAGMIAHWLRHRGRSWRRSLAFNAVGCTMSAIVFLVVGATKFTSGAWVVVLLIPSIVLVLLAIHRHYAWVREVTAVRDLPDGRKRPSIVPNTAPAQDATSQEAEEAPDQLQPLCVVPVDDLELPTLRALAYAVSLRQPTLAIHLTPDEADGERFLKAWQAWGDHVPLEVVSSPYRALVAPLANYIAALRAQKPSLTITVVMSDLVVARRWQQLLHERSGDRLRRALRLERNTVITVVPFHVPERGTAAGVELSAIHAHGGRPKSRPPSDDTPGDPGHDSMRNGRRRDSSPAEPPSPRAARGGVGGPHGV
jgi:amino acid transporter